MRRTPSSAASATERPGASRQQIDRFRMHRLHHRRDLLFGADARRIQAIGAGLRIGLQPIDHHGEIGLANQKPLAASGQQYAAVIGVDRGPRRLDALDRERAVVQRLGLVAGGILDRQPGHADLDRARHVGRDLLRLVREAAFEVGIDGQIDRRAQRGEMIADIVERDVIVGLADRPGKAGAGGGERLEAEAAAPARCRCPTGLVSRSTPPRAACGMRRACLLS